jgi:hypothetical protein
MGVKTLGTKKNEWLSWGNLHIECSMHRQGLDGVSYTHIRKSNNRVGNDMYKRDPFFRKNRSANEGNKK